MIGFVSEREWICSAIFSLVGKIVDCWLFLLSPKNQLFMFMSIVFYFFYFLSYQISLSSWGGHVILLNFTNYQYSCNLCVPIIFKFDI